MEARAKSRAVALVVVLACVVMITMMVVAFLSTVQTELHISKSSSDASGLKNLADTSVNLVISQVRSATTEAADRSFAWASQPGMIRTFDHVNGALAHAYKLYSSDKMIDTAVDIGGETAAFATWNREPALFVDLNAPRSSVYPIVDPRASADPGAVKGFWLDSPPGDGAEAAPMPAKWLYVLRDGVLAAPTAGSDSASAEVIGATADNPIVGRIAFWTDDETCRLNVNTAAGDLADVDPGSFWDLPYFDGTYERDLSSRQPANKEYQRYPGHPSTVSLAEVFPDLTREEIYDIVPRVVDGGSQGGSIVAPATIPIPDQDRLFASVDELVFSNSLDEAGEARKPNPVTNEQLERTRFFLTSSSRAPDLNLFGMPRVSMWPVHADLAKDPNSPYTTAFDRLSAFCSTFGSGIKYYIQRRNADSPTEDYQSIARNREIYSYLQNLTARSVPGFGGNFLAKYPQPPGAQASDRDQILTQAFDYIRSTNLFDVTLGGNFSVGSPANGAASEIPAEGSFYQFTNPHRPPYYAWAGHGQAAPISIGNTKGFGRFYGVSEVAIHVICTADGNGVDINANGSAHDHRTVSNLIAASKLRLDNGTLVGPNYNSSDNFPANPTLADTLGGPATALQVGQKRMQAVLLVKCFSPSQGFPIIVPDFVAKVDGLDKLEIGGAHPFPASSNGRFRQFGRFGISQTTGGLGTWMLFLNTFSLTAGNPVNTRYVPRWDATEATPFVYKWVSDPFTVSGNGISFGNPDDDITIEIFAGNGERPEGERSLTDADPPPDADSLVQTLKIRFPSATIPAPDLLKWGHQTPSTGIANTVRAWWSFSSRFSRFNNQSIGLHWTAENRAMATGQGAGSFIRLDPINDATPWKLNETRQAWPADDYTQANNFNSDVVRSLIPKDGDARLILGRKVADASAWVPHPDYFNPSVKLAHTLASGGAPDAVSSTTDVGPPGNFRQSKLVSSVSHYRRAQIPNIPEGVTSAEITGDWDNGLGLVADGAYINMADEGLIETQNGVPPYYAQGQDAPPSAAQFSPNRIVASPGLLGSLPTGVQSNTPWQTLLFRPQPSHPQSRQSRPGHPPDHLFMDLFTMSAVEPYAISEPFSTAGKVNLNYQIVPYTYIHRATALRAVLSSEKVAAVPTTDGESYKRNLSTTGPFRFSINPDVEAGTLRQLEERFANGDIFRSATEICDIYLTPEGENWATNAGTVDFWSRHKLTGDNARERPYAKLYGKLTTRSNSYQVFYCVQTLQKVKGTNNGEWVENRDKITGEQRGSVIFERYLDPTGAALPDHATNFSELSLDRFFRFRILSKKIFDN